MTDEQKKQMQLLYDLKGASIGLSAEQEELLQELEDRFIADEIMPALGKHVLPLMKQLHGAFTLEVIQTANQQRAYFKRDDDYSARPYSHGGQASVVNEPTVSEPSEEPTTPDDGKGEKKKRQRTRPNFRFSMVGIQPGEWITFTPTGLRVKVVTDNKVEYDGQQYKLSPFVVKFLPDHMRNRKDAYQGPKYFTYQGQRLDDLRPDKRKKKGKACERAFIRRMIKPME